MAGYVRQPVHSLAQYLGLRDVNRDGLEPSPSRDPDLYVDLDDHLRRVTEELAKKQPRLAVIGEYGTGKSHLLHRTLKDAADLDRFTGVYAELPAHPRPSSTTLHGDVMRAFDRSGVLGRVAKVPDIENALEFSRTVPGVGRALALLGDDDEMRRAQARTWLWGIGPTPTQATRLGLPGRLADSARGVEVVHIWEALARVFERVEHRRILLALDEAEAFQRTLRADGAVDIGTALRTLAEQDSFGFLLGLTLPDLRSDHPLLRTDVASRLQGQRLELQRLGAGRTSRFIGALLERLTARRASVATDDFVATFEELDGELVGRLGAGPKAVTGMTQRQAVKVLNAVYQDAWGASVKLPLSGVALRRWRK